MTVARALELIRLAELELEAVEAAPAPAAPVMPPPAARPLVAAPAAGAGLTDPTAFFAVLRASKVLGPTLEPGEVSGCEAILAACAGKMPTSWTAYALATAYHETAHTMQPIHENGGPKYFHNLYDPQGSRPQLAKDNGNVNPGDGVKYHGRGYVQLTWRANYRRAGEKLGLPLEETPDLALQPSVAADILVRGMIEGWFTGKSLRSYIPAAAELKNFVAARRIINGTDKADLIAGYAMTFLKALHAGGWQ
jgi:putative chitinase